MCISSFVFNVSTMCQDGYILLTLMKPLIVLVYVKDNWHTWQSIRGLMPVHLCDHSILYFSLTNNLIIQSSVYWTTQASWFYHVCNIYKFSTPLTDTLTTQSAINTSSYWGCGATPESDMNTYWHIKIQQAYLQYVLLLFPGKRCFIQLHTGVRIYTMIFNSGS